MSHFNELFPIDISDGASDSEDAIKYPSRQMETLGRGNCDFAGFILDFEKILDFLIRHLRISMNLCSSKSFPLYDTR